MGSLLAKIQSNPWLKNMLLMSILVGACAGAFWWGKKQPSANPTPGRELGPNGLPISDTDQRVVAYLHTDIPITRGDLGEYLIARFGAERLEFLVNRRIVELEAKKAHVYVSDDEVEARFKRDLYSFNPPLTERDFVNTVLKRFQKNLYEWKEDVIRPKVLMEKIVEAKVVIGEKDLQKGFEARFGPRIDCRMIVLDNRDMSIVQKKYAIASKSREEFLKAAGEQFIPNLQQTQGKVPPIHKHFGDPALEEAAFRLDEGKISPLITLKDGTIVMLMCEKKLPADVSVSLEKVRIKLAEEMRELRIAQRIPEEFAEMRKRANPWLLLNSGGQHQGIPTQGSGTSVPALTTSHIKPVEPETAVPALTPGTPAPRKEEQPPEPKAGTPIPVAPPEALVPLQKGPDVKPKDAAPTAPKTPVAPPVGTVVPAPVPGLPIPVPPPALAPVIPAPAPVTPSVVPPLAVPPPQAPMKK